MTRVQIGLGIAFGGLVLLALALVANGGLSGSVPAGIYTIGYVLLGLLVIAGILWALSRSAALAAGAVGSVPRLATWLIALVLLVLLAVFWTPFVALFPATTQARLTAFGNGLYDNWILALFIIAAFLLLLKQRTAAAVVAGIAVLAFFLMPDATGLNRAERFHAWLTTPAPRLTATPATLPQQPVSKSCDVDRRPHYFPAQKPAYKVNEGGKCSLQLFIEGHCVYYTQNYNDATAGIICLYGGQASYSDLRGNKIEMPVDVDRVWSANGVAFHGSIGLWQPNYTKAFSWR